MLIASDLLITDCSYLALDYLYLNRPMVFTIGGDAIMPKWFKKNVPGKKVYNLKQLKWAIKQFTNKKEVFEEPLRNKFVKWFVPFNDGQSSARVVNSVMEIHKS
jgi:CDP-glycerol glycerophosphotransferase (TagB/SpsB family)